MKLDEFAYLNQQLAGMLRAGIPLEGALRQTCATLQSGRLRTELQALESDLASGVPLGQAIARRQLPEFYTRMLELGAQTRDLPGLLTLLADYYQRVHLTWTRLQGLIFYPALVLFFSFVVSLLAATIFSRFRDEMYQSFGGLAASMPTPGAEFLIRASLWLPVTMTALLAGSMAVCLAVPRWRESLRWRLPGFREARLANLASSIHLLLRGGCPLDTALRLVEQLERDTPAGPEIARWRSRLAEGLTGFPQLAGGGRIVPPLFVWLVAASGENWIDGFHHAAEVYHERAGRRAELLLYAVLPTSVLALGGLIIVQLFPLARVFAMFARDLIDVNGN